jgi:hypothetical protein
MRGVATAFWQRPTALMSLCITRRCTAPGRGDHSSERANSSTSSSPPAAEARRPATSRSPSQWPRDTWRTTHLQRCSRFPLSTLGGGGIRTMPGRSGSLQVNGTLLTLPATPSRRHGTPWHSLASVGTRGFPECGLRIVSQYPVPVEFRLGSSNRQRGSLGDAHRIWGIARTESSSRA